MRIFDDGEEPGEPLYPKLLRREASFALSGRMYVTDHARWRAAERFPWFDTTTIEEEVRQGLAAGRVGTDRYVLGLSRQLANPGSLYVWTEDRERIYAIKVNARDEDEWIVTTTMRRGM